MYVNKCTKCGREFETKNPKRVICPNCLYPDKKMMPDSDEGKNDGKSDAGEPKKFYSSYSNRWLAHWQYQSVRNEVERHERTGRFISWDYQMLWSVRSNGLYGVVPLRNQITNVPHRRS